MLVDNAANTLSLSITPWNYTVASFLTALNVKLATGIKNVLGIVATYSDITNKCAFTCPYTNTLGLSTLNTMHSCVEFPNGVVTNTYHYN